MIYQLWHKLDLNFYRFLSDSFRQFRQLLGRGHEPAGQVQRRVHRGSPSASRLEVVQPNTQTPQAHRQTPGDPADHQRILQPPEDEVSISPF